MGESKPTRLIVSPNTGEVTGEICEGDRIIRKASVEYLNTTQVWRLDSFFMGHVGEIGNWAQELSTHECAFLFKIVTYIGYEDCCLKYSNGKPLGTEDLVKITGMPKATVYRVINSLTKKDILCRVKNSSKERQYFINPWLFCKGNRINKVLKTMFRNYKIRVLGGIAWKNVPIEK